MRVNTKFVIDIEERTSEEGKPITAISLVGRKDDLISMDPIETVWARFREVPNHADHEWEEEKQLLNESMRHLAERKARQTQNS